MMKSKDGNLLFLFTDGLDCLRLKLVYCNNALITDHIGIYCGHARSPTVVLAQFRYTMDTGQGMKEREDVSKL